jgi:hypothetical protein
VATQEVELPLSQIEVDPENVRSAYDPDVIAGLRQALEVSGEYINPPVVYALGGDRYRVKHGSTRVLAAKGVRTTLRVRLGEPPESNSTKLLSQMSENLLQGSLRPADIGNALKRLRWADGRERSISQLVGALKAGGINRTKAWVLMHLALAELDPAVQSLINRGELAAEVGYQLRILSPQEQLAWSGRIIERGLTREDVRRELGLSSAEDVPPEFTQRQIGDRLSEVAQDSASQETRRRPPVAGERRNSTVSVRRELLAVSIESPDARKLRPLSASDWAKKATDVERQLAQEALFFGGYSSAQAIALVDRAMSEVPQASEAVMAALNAVRRLVEHPAELPAGSGLAEILALRLERVLHNLGR